MDVLMHWIATAPTHPAARTPVVVPDPDEAERLRDLGWTVEGPFVPEADCRGAVEALAELVRLKDDPRDDAYRAAKDAAWDAARSIVGESIDE